jgi:molecular chaperone GrpE
VREEMENEQAENEGGEREECLTRSEKNSEENGKLEELANALQEEKKRSEGYLNRLKYMQADFENLKKRLDRQLEEVRKYCNERLVLELLGIVDELEAAVHESKRTESVEALLKGVEMTLKKLKKVLELEEVSPIDCVGQAFDPSKHEAVAKVESEEEGKVVEEIRKGYTMKGKVIRPSAVKITAKPSSETTGEVESDE